MLITSLILGLGGFLVAFVMLLVATLRKQTRRARLTIALLSVVPLVGNVLFLLYAAAVGSTWGQGGSPIVVVLIGVFVVYVVWLAYIALLPDKP